MLVCERGRLAAYSGKKLLWTTEGGHPLRALTVVSKEHLAGCRGDTVFLWRTTGELLWSCQLDHKPIRLASDPWGRWLVALGESLTYLRLHSGEVVRAGPENVGASMDREEEFASMRFAPELRFASASGRHAWTPVAVRSDRDLSVLWDGRSLNLDQGRSGPRYEGFAFATHACLGLDTH
jgi:hypothetical protein